MCNPLRQFDVKNLKFNLNFPDMRVTVELVKMLFKIKMNFFTLFLKQINKRLLKPVDSQLLPLKLFLIEFGD